MAQLRGDFMASGYRILELDARAPGAAALLERVCASFPGQRIEAVTRGDAELAALLEAQGFERFEDRIHVERSLADAPPLESPSPFTLVGYEAAGKASFVEALERVLPPDELGAADLTAAELMEEIIHAATTGDGRLDASLWRLVLVDGALAGVILPRAQGDAGGLLHFGVVPELRGRGLGAALLGAALVALRRAGVRRYVDSAVASNAPMLRLFARLGCTTTGSSSRWVLRRARVPEHAAGFAEVVAVLRAEGHPVEVRDGDGWARVATRFGEHAAEVDVLWLRHRRLVQVVHCFPFVVPGTAAAEVCRKNEELDLPGFTLEADRGALRYQVSLMPDGAGRIETNMLRRALEIVVRTVAISTPYWRGQHVGNGSPAWATSWSD